MGNKVTRQVIKRKHRVKNLKRKKIIAYLKRNIETSFKDKYMCKPGGSNDNR